MNVDKNNLILLRKKTKLSFSKCIEALKKTNNNLILAEKFLYKNCNKIKKNKLFFYSIYIYNYKNLILILKIKFESFFIKNFKELNNLIKKIILILIKFKNKNIFYLLKRKIKFNYLKKNIEIIKKKINENFIIKKYNILKFKKKNIIYNYENKLCVIINYNNKNKYLTKNICIHILINKPLFISLKSIKKDTIINKYNKLKKIKIINDKILNKIIKKYTLLNQNFIKNNIFKINNILKIKKININFFFLYK